MISLSVHDLPKKGDDVSEKSEGKVSRIITKYLRRPIWIEDVSIKHWSDHNRKKDQPLAQALITVLRMTINIQYYVSQDTYGYG